MKKLFNLILVVFFLITPVLASSAEMYLVLDKSQVTENGTFSGTVYVSSGGVAINNAEATLTFPTDLLSVDSISTSGSIFNMWVEQPSFSNSNGAVYFNGGLPTPGYNGQAGNSLRVNFRAKKAGLANLSFISPAIRADDGNGTNVLSKNRGSGITITSATPVVPVAPVPTPVTPPKNVVSNTPVIFSDDMPDQNAWYNKTEALFSWEVPAGVNSLQLIFSESANATPNVTYDPPIKKKLLSDLTDGTYYLNARFKNAAGWGKVASRKIKIDTQAPFDLKVEVKKTSDNLISFNASAKDNLSGIKNYVVSKDKTKLVDAVSVGDGATEFNLPVLSAGGHKLELVTYDFAGNSASIYVDVEVVEPKPNKLMECLVSVNCLISNGSVIIQITSIVITLVLLIGLLAAIMYMTLYRLSYLRRKLRRDFIGTEKEIQVVFQMLTDDVQSHLKMLEKAGVKRKLTKEEMKIMFDLNEKLLAAQKYMNKKIKKLSKKTK